jgi:integrase
MSRRRSLAPPSYRLHRQSGQAIVTLRDHAGNRRDFLLGKYGTPESRQEYARIVAEWETSNAPAMAATARPTCGHAFADITVNEILAAFLKHCESYYVKDGKPTSEQREYKLAMSATQALYGRTVAADFGPLALKTIRNGMIDKGLARGVINQRIARIRRIFKWAVGEELVPPAVLEGLRAVEGLKRGRTVAREPESVTPVADDLVNRTLPHLNRQVAAMVRLQRLTGMRPGEVAIMRAADIDMSGPIWLFRPEGHKTEYRGKDRLVALGPRGQAIIKEFLTVDLGAYLFSPQDAREERYAAMRAARKSRVQPSQLHRRKVRPKKSPASHYSPRSYHDAIQRACEKHDLPAWHPHQLRHSHGTDVRRRFGLEAAQVSLGHASANVTEIYAERDLSLAVKVAQAVG